MRESKIEAKVREYAEDKGVWFRKFTTPGRAFAPDRMLVAPKGTIMMLEFKAPGKKPTDAQFRELHRWNQRHIMAEWVDSVARGREMVD